MGWARRRDQQGGQGSGGEANAHGERQDRRLTPGELEDAFDVGNRCERVRSGEAQRDRAGGQGGSDQAPIHPKREVARITTASESRELRDIWLPGEDGCDQGETGKLPARRACEQSWRWRQAGQGPRR